MSLGEGKLNLSTLPLSRILGESITIDIISIDCAILDKNCIYIRLLYTHKVYNTYCIKITFDNKEIAQEEHTKILSKLGSEGILLISLH